MKNQHFSSAPIDQLLAQLQSSEKGLQSAIAAEKIKAQAKLSKIESRHTKQLKLLIRQFTNPLILLLVIAVILSAILRQSSDSFIIFSILLTTGLLGFWQEYKAGKAMEQLRTMTEMTSTVMRDGQIIQLPTRQVVPGDIILLDAGDIIPADCRIIESNELHINESTLTGESFPVEKSAGQLEDVLPLSKKYNCLWQGTNVISGSATALAVHTGSDTLFGQMAHSIIQTPDTAFEKGIRHFGFFLLRITLVLSLFILLTNLYFQKPFFDAVLFSLALAIGMAPELLPAIMTFSMAVGIKKMLTKKVIVKKLSSIFNFGEVNVLCTDKTGTITEGIVTIKDIVGTDGKTSDRIRLYAFLNAALQNGFTNPIDQAIVSLNISAGTYEKINEIPYEFIRKRLSVAVKSGADRFIITKGAFNNVLQVCSYLETDNEKPEPLKDEDRKQLENDYISYNQEGYRVLGLCYKPIQKDKITRDDEREMIFLGFILLEDKLKENVLSSIQQLEQLHIAVKIITGDNRFAAFHAAKNIGMKDPVILTGEEMDRLYPEALVVKVRHTDIFAEIDPHQKEIIIKALQKSHLAVAYVGDGFNDVAAINAADIGISTSNAVDIAKEAADFVLLEKDLSVLADGIHEGRKSFANSMKYIFITTGATFGNMLSIAGASLFLPFLPMLPKQILLTNLVTDLPFLTIAADHVDNEDLATPRKWNIKLIRRFMIVFGLHSSLFDFITFYVLYIYFGLSNSAFQTGWFLESAITEILILFVVRTKKSIIKSQPGKLLLITALTALCIIIYLPFSPFAALLGFSIANAQQIIAIGMILVVYLLTADLLKMAFFRFYEKQAQPL